MQLTNRRFPAQTLSRTRPKSPDREEAREIYPSVRKRNPGLEPCRDSYSRRSHSRSSLFAIFSLVAPAIRAQQSNPAPEPRIDPTAELLTYRLWEKAAPGALGDKPEDIPTLTFYPATHHDNPVPPSLSPLAAATVSSPPTTKVARSPTSSTPWASPPSSSNIASVPATTIPSNWATPSAPCVSSVPAPKNSTSTPLKSARWASQPEATSISTLATHFDSGLAADPDPINHQPCRPDFVILAYPVISMTAPYSHQRFRTEPPRKSPRSRLSQGTFERTQRHLSHPSNLPFQHLDRHGRPTRKHRRLLPGIAQSGRPCRNAHLRKRPARRGSGPQRHRLVGMGNSAKKLAASPRHPRAFELTRRYWRPRG